MKEKLECKIVHNTLGYGRIVNFNFKEVQNSLINQNRKEFFEEINQVIIDVSIMYREIKDSIHDCSKIEEKMVAIIIEQFGTSAFNEKFRELITKNKLTASEALDIAVQEHFREDNEIIFGEIREHVSLFYEYLYDLASRLNIHFEMYVFKRFTQNITHDYIVVVDEFKIEYMDEMSARLQGIICKKADDLQLAREYSNAFELPIAIADYEFHSDYPVIIDAVNSQLIINPDPEDIKEYRETLKSQTFVEGEYPLYQSDQIKLYASMVDDRYANRIAFGHWFQGVIPFKSEYMLSTNELHLSLDYQYNYFSNLFSILKDKEFYYRIPDFRPERPTAYFGDVYTDVETYEMLEPVIDNLLFGLALAAKKHNVLINVVVPMIRMPDEVHYWVSTIRESFDMYGVKNVKVGMMIETESAFEYFEDYPKMDFVIIGLNDLIEEISDDYDRYSQLSKDEFIETFWPDLRELHQYLRSYTQQVKHIVAGNFLTNEWIFKKLINSGFRHFAIQVNQVRQIEQMLHRYENTRGLYIGYSELREMNQKEVDANKAERARRRLLKDKAKLLEREEKLRLKKQLILDEHKEKREIAIQKMLEERDLREKTQKIQKSKKNTNQKR